MKTLAVIITAADVEPGCLAALNAQTTPVPWLIVRTPAERHSDNYIVNLYRNCAANRETARRLALASDADAFLILDSDIVIPAGAVAEFERQARPDCRIIGGWYQMLRSGRWVAGRWVANHTFVNFRAVQPSLTRTDMVGLGCAFIPRHALERIPFEHGTDLMSRDERGRPLIVGECGAFGNRAAEAGFPMFMDGDVVCEHLERSNGTNPDSGSGGIDEGRPAGRAPAVGGAADDRNV